MTAAIRFRQFITQFLCRRPHNMIVLACIEMDLVQCVAVTRKYNGDIESMGEAGFIVDTSARSVISMCEIRNYKARPSYFGYDFITYLTHVFLLIDAKCFISGVSDRWVDAIFPHFGH